MKLGAKSEKWEEKRKWRKRTSLPVTSSSDLLGMSFSPVHYLSPLERERSRCEGVPGYT